MLCSLALLVLVAAPADAPAAANLAPPSAASLSLDFDLLEEAPAPAPLDPIFEAQLQRRRSMLQLHQGLGLATWASFAATEVVGQLNYLDKYNRGGNTGRWKVAHLGLAITSTALFTTVASLGLLAPDPFQKELKLDASTLHKVFMSAAAVGLLGQFILGLYTASLDGQLQQRDLALAHLVMGYATVGAFSAGAVMLMF